MKKFLILYASYGGGHSSAAKSIKKYLEENYNDLEVELVDCMKYVSPFMEKITTGAYKGMAKNAPRLWGKVYKHSKKGALAGISNESNRLLAPKLFKLIQKIEPDLIVSTHPFSSQMVNYLKKKGKLDTKLATILTDFEFHEQWIVGHKFTDCFFVSNEDMKRSLVRNNVDGDKIIVTGIPFSERFLETFNKEEIHKMFELDINKKGILVFGGGEYDLGKDRTVNLLRSLIGINKDFQVVAIAGKNEKMKLAFEEVVEEMNSNDRVRVLPFTDKVPELMSISYVVVTKPGGLTTTESLISNLPLIIINPLPGQEEENAVFLERHGVGKWIRKDDNPEVILSELLNNPDKIEEMRNNIKSIAKPNSTKDICDKLLSSI